MPLTQYVTDSRSDLLLAGWWRKIAMDGELQSFSIGGERLSQFLAWFQAPTTLWYDLDEAGINFALWIEPQTPTAAWVHLYLAPHVRSTKQALTNILNALGSALERYPVLLGTTKSAALANEHVKVGFVKLGVIPYCFDGEDCHLTYLTRDAFVAANSDKLDALERATARKKK